MERLRSEQIDLKGLRPGGFGDNPYMKKGKDTITPGSPEWLLLNGAARFDPVPGRGK